MRKILSIRTLSFLKIFTALGFVVFPVSAFAQKTINITLVNPLNNTPDIPTFVSNALSTLALFIAPIVVVMLIYTGFLFVTAQGNAEKIGAAKKALMFTLIGAAIVLGAKAFAEIIQAVIKSFAA